MAEESRLKKKQDKFYKSKQTRIKHLARVALYHLLFLNNHERQSNSSDNEIGFKAQAISNFDTKQELYNMI